MSSTKKLTGLAMATVLATGLIACKGEAAAAQAKPMKQGYQNTQAPKAATTNTTKAGEAKCGEAKCGEAKCGAATTKKTAAAACGANAKKTANAACGGKNAAAACGANTKNATAKCGANGKNATASCGGKK
ncbi:HvfA family oxazolone/thioamide-modified RiPP metallophore [Moraxella marmotae]|uniref:HvfA family oxazolone/thioamide-modified RiPP metallophore n=1 Tax=Moraxella marmotae TaxID=3344520 RepID=UPI0035D4A230